MDAIELYKSYREDMTDEEVTQLCQAILDAPGNRAWVIYSAKLAGWWRYEVAEPCQAILDAPGDRALAIRLAKRDGWWKEPINNNSNN